MFKSISKIVIIIVLMIHSFSGNSSADQSSYDYFFYEADSNIAMPRFDLSLGTLNSVTYEISNMNLGSTVILDLDDNSGPFSINNAIVGHTIGVGPVGSPLWGSLFQMQRYVSGDFISDDDGDGIGLRNGGDDEIISTSGFLNYSGTKSFTDSEHLDALSSIYMPITSVGPIMNTAAFSQNIWEPSRTIETYWENITYSGNFRVTYDFTPIAPEPFSSTLFVIGGVMFGCSIFWKRTRT